MVPKTFRRSDRTVSDLLVTGRRAGKLHFGSGRDAAVVLAVEDRLPLPVDLADFDDRAAMGSHFDIDQFLGVFAEYDLVLFLAVLRHLFDTGEVREHDLGIGIFVVDDQQAVVGLPSSGMKPT